MRVNELVADDDDMSWTINIQGADAAKARELAGVGSPMTRADIPAVIEQLKLQYEQLFGRPARRVHKGKMGWITIR